MTDQTYTLAPWSLDDLFPSSDGPEMAEARQELDRQVASFEGVRGDLRAEITLESFMALIPRLERISEQAYRIQAYAALRFSADTQDQAAQTFMAQIQQEMAGLYNRTMFFELWWKGLEDAEAERLMAGAGEYTYWLQEMRNFKPHTLSEAEEKIVNLKNVTGASALVTLYETLTNRYVFKLEVDGEVQEIGREELMSHVRSSDPDLRARAYQELYRVYTADSSILGQIYQNLVRDWRNEQVGLRSFEAPISARNLRNDVPDEVVDTLLEVSEKNAHLFHRYFRLKARWLGVDKLRRYDIYAPVAAGEKRYEFEEAVDLVLESFRDFEPRLADLAHQVLADDHLDSEVRPGKRDGAFCMSVTPDLTPWVLVNYQGRSRDLETLAHELGHAIHSLLAADNPLFTFRAPLPLAETASTFGEMMLVDRLLAEEEDEAVRRDILFRQVDGAYGTIMRQVFFAIFERQAHEMIQKGASTEELAAAYLENLQTQFGDSLELSDEFRWEWILIPHMYHTPFYVYAYSFGQLLVLSLYKQFKEEGESFKPRYLEILKAGGTDAPVEILRRAGIEVHKASFWQGGFDVVKDMIEELEQLPVEAAAAG